MAESKTQNPPARTPCSEPSASPGGKAPARQPCKYYIHDSATALRLQLFGDFTETEVPELTGCWDTAKTTLGQRKLIVDIRGLRSADDAGKKWLFEMAAEGADFLPETYLRDGIKAEAISEPAKVRPGWFIRVLSLVRGSRAVQA